MLSLPGLVLMAVGFGAAIAIVCWNGHLSGSNWAVILIAILLILWGFGIAIAAGQERQQWRRDRQALETSLAELRDRCELEKKESEQILKDQINKYRAVRQENQTLHKINARKDEFLRQTSHELRTPMNGIICSLQLLLDELCDDREEELELLQQAHQSSIHLLGLINQVLDLAKIESGKVSVELKPIDLHASLTAALYLQFANFRQKNLELHRRDFVRGIKVQADPIKLKQILINLIGNAIKFTDRGSITIVTEIRPMVSPEGETQIPMAIVTIKDTGIGIDPNNKDKLFEAFQVEDESHLNPYGSSGLGLVISKHLIEMMGGSIHLMSPGKGQGTTVELVLPLAETDGIPEGAENGGVGKIES
ncbi:MAG: sensor histidine kinase [Limnospira sp.]